MSTTYIWFEIGWMWLDQCVFNFLIILFIVVLKPNKQVISFNKTFKTVKHYFSLDCLVKRLLLEILILSLYYSTRSGRVLIEHGNRKSMQFSCEGISWQFLNHFHTQPKMYIYRCSNLRNLQRHHDTLPLDHLVDV